MTTPSWEDAICPTQGSRRSARQTSAEAVPIQHGVVVPLLGAEQHDLVDSPLRTLVGQVERAPLADGQVRVVRGVLVVPPQRGREVLERGVRSGHLDQL